MPPFFSQIPGLGGQARTFNLSRPPPWPWGQNQPGLAIKGEAANGLVPPLAHLAPLWGLHIGPWSLANKGEA
jgi:hypothetical protein